MDISVIIPTYKPGDYIWQCLDSLKSQTLSHDSFEAIIILNGCNEPYYSQIKNYLANWPQTLQHTFVQTDEGGVSNARNMGIDLAKGKYLSFLDDDDWISPTYLERLCEKAVNDDTLVIANVKNYDEKAKEMRDDWLSASYKKNASLLHPSLLSCRSFLSVTCCKLISRKAIADHRFDTRFRQGEDSLFFAGISHKLKQFRCTQPDAVYYIRIRAKSAGRARSAWNIISDNARLAWAFIKLFLKAPCHYNFLFFMTRVAACAKGTIRNIRHSCLSF